MGHFMADFKYGNSSSKAGEQLSLYSNGYIPGLSCHLVALENYDPTIPLSTYPFSWILKGVYYDLIDARNDNTASPSYVSLNDQASGYYTNQKLFNAFGSSITSLQAYKANLLTQNSNNQSAFVNTIFTFYGY